MSAIEREKHVKCRTGGQESVRISVIAGVRNNESLICFSHFFIRFAGGGLLSAIAWCP